MKKIRILLIALGIAAQFAALSSILVKREMILRYGEVHRFKTAPVDPYDPFRGRYVALGFDIESKPIETPRVFYYDQYCYAQLGADSNGFATVEALFSEKPEGGSYIKTQIRYSYASNETSYLIKLPFDRFYMPEKLAPEAERAYQKANRRGDTQSAAAVVRVWRGDAVIQDLEINGVPILEYLKNTNPK